MEGIELTIHLRFVIALGLGFLLDLERESSGFERKRHVIAGTRTYSLISLYGLGCAWISELGIALAFPIGLISIAGLAGIEYMGRLKEGHSGWTSSVAVLITFIVGALAFLTNIWWKLLALALGALVLAIYMDQSASKASTSVASTMTNLFEIMPAMVFAALFVSFKVITNLVMSHFGSSGLLALSFFVGVTDIDPYILSIINSTAVTETMVDAILIAMMGNTLIKGVYFGGLAREARKESLYRYGMLTLLHVPFIVI